VYPCQKCMIVYIYQHKLSSFSHINTITCVSHTCRHSFYTYAPVCIHAVTVTPTLCTQNTFSMHKLDHTHTHTHTDTHRHTHTHKHTHTHTHVHKKTNIIVIALLTLTHECSHTFLSLSVSLSLSHIHTHITAWRHSHTHTHSCAHTFILGTFTHMSSYSFDTFKLIFSLYSYLPSQTHSQ
jgi:hypothetical protein